MTAKKEKAMLHETLLLKKEPSDVNWILIDAEGKTLGRLAAEVTKILRGKHKPTFTPSVDLGDGVIIINAEKVYTTGNKGAQKIYRRHTGYLGNMREVPLNVVLARDPQRPITQAVKGMMPKTRLSNAQLKRLRVIAGSEHGMEAQKPIQVNI